MIGQLQAADREGREDRSRGQPVDHRHQRRDVAGRAVGDARAELDQDRVVDQAVADELLDHHEVPRVEDLELRAHAERLHAARHRAQHRRRVRHDVVATRGEVHRAAVERAELGQRLAHVHEPLARSGQVGARGIERQRRLVSAEHQVAAHAGREVEHHVHVGRAHALHDLAVQARVARAAPGLGIAHVDMRDRGAGLGRLDRRIGDGAGVIGTRSDLPVVSPAPVTAQVMKTSQFTAQLRIAVATSAREPIRPAHTASSVPVSTPPLRLDGRSALVTGCGSEAGIGFACAELLASSGRGLRSPRRRDRIEQRAAELRAAGATVHAHVADLTDPEQARAARGRRRERATARSTCSSTTPGLAQIGVESEDAPFAQTARGDVPARPRAQPADRVPRHAGGAAGHAGARLRAHRDGLVGHRPARHDAGLGRLLHRQGRDGRDDALARARRRAQRRHRELGAAGLDRDGLVDRARS